mmetsp:Transcript_21419/g.44778  ORF Transcript_21419/g.44778 Transcript_21419/m.44778 type:complete len:101 (+) Transcript_21419:1388-1690(+)
MTPEKAADRFKARLEETLDKCAELRGTIEALKSQRDQLDEELIEQREEYKELEKNMQRTIDELETNLDDAVEKIHVLLLNIVMKVPTKQVSGKNRGDTWD